MPGDWREFRIVSILDSAVPGLISRAGNADKSLMKTSKNMVFVVFVAFALSGCGRLDFTQSLLRPDAPLQIASKAQGIEVVSASAVGQHTVVNGYTVDTSVGAIQDRLVSKTPNGYVVYHGVKGEIVSEQ